MARTGSPVYPEGHLDSLCDKSALAMENQGAILRIRKWEFREEKKFISVTQRVGHLHTFLNSQGHLIFGSYFLDVLRTH
jgi:hypothetical protein